MPVNAQFPPCYFGMWSGPSYAGGKRLKVQTTKGSRLEFPLNSN